MRTSLVLAGCALALVACRKNEPAAQKPARVVTKVIPEKLDPNEEKNLVIRPDVPNVLDKSLLGTKLAPDGTVAEEAKEFRVGAPIALTIWLRESPPGLSTGVKWYGSGDRIVAQEQHPMNGGKLVTFRLQTPLAPGKYRVEGYWGGNVVADKSFEVKP